MPERLIHFWRTLDTIPGRLAAPERWRGELGDEWPWASALLRPAMATTAYIGTADRLPLYDPGCGWYLGFMPEVGGPDLPAGCDGGDDVPPLHELDVRRLGGCVAAALDVAGDVVELAEVSDACRLGRHRATNVEVFLATPPDPRAMRTIVAELVASDARPFVVLTPTKARWCDWPRGLAGRGAVVALCDVVRAGAGPAELAPVVSPEDALRVDTELAADPNVFRRQGEMWVLSFAGRTVYMEHGTGYEYLAHLLAHPGRPIPAAELVAAVRGEPRVLADARASVGHDAADRMTLMDCHRRLAALDAEVARAAAGGDGAAVARAEAEKRQIREYLMVSTGLRFRARKLGGADRHRGAVTMAISRAMERIRECHLELWLHLDTAVQTGHAPCYAPAPPVVWDL